MWDMRVNKSPVSVLDVDERVDSQMDKLIKYDKTFDLWNMNVSPGSTRLLTGSYYDQAHVIDI